MLGLTGFRLIYAPTIIPAYLHLLTGSAALVGLGQSLLQFGAIASPILSGAKIEQQRRILPHAVRIGGMMRLMILGLAIAGWTLGGWPLLVVTLALLLGLGYFSGAQRVAFQSLLAKVIPIRRRGRLQAWRNLFGGVIAAGLAWFAGTVLIGNDVLGNGYSSTFMLAFVLTALGLLVLQFMIDEPEGPPPLAPVRFVDRLRAMPALIGRGDFRNFVIAQTLATGGRIAAPFYTLFAGLQLGLSGTVIGGLSLAFLGADTASNLIWGNLGDRFGFRIVFIGALGSWLTGLALLLFAQGEWPLYTAFAFLGAGTCGWMMASATMVLEFGAPHELPMRLALITTIEGAVSALGPLLGGLIVYLFGYIPLLAVSGISVLSGLVLILFRVREPRNREIDATLAISLEDERV